MSTATRDDVRLNLLHILPAGTTLRVTAHNPRRSSSGLMRTSIRFYSSAGHNISEAVAIALGDRYSSTDNAVRGTFGGLNPALQAVSELARNLHGSSTAFRYSNTAPAPQPVLPRRTPARSR